MESRLPVPDRETIVQYLAANDLHYQRIELPFGLATPGPDRSETAQQIFPADLGGQSVLDVGCYLGYFCHEARRRHAGRVVGVDVDETRLAHARALARFAGHEITFRRLDIEEEDLDETFDIVLLLNVIHHARRPMDLLAKVARCTARQLVLEVPSVSDGPMRQYLRRHFRLRRRQVARLERLPLIGVGRDGALDGRSEQSFFFTPEAIRSVLLDHRRLFARVDVLPTARRGRFAAVAHRRRIGELLVLAAPSGAGKTHLAERVLSGSDPVLAGRLGIERPETWQAVTAQELRTLETPEVGRLLLHYDLLRPWRGGARSFARDEALDVLACAQRARVCTLYCPPPALIARLERRCATVTGDGLTLAREALALYRQPGLLATTYAEWLTFCAGQGLEPRVVDASGDSYPELTGDRLPVPLQAER